MKRVTAEDNLNPGTVLQQHPNRKWLLDVLSTLRPGHDIFKKNYLPPIVTDKKENKVIDNSDSFFSDLPRLTKKRDLKVKSRLKDY